MIVVNQSIIKHKMGLLSLAEELHNVSQACRVMGVSRDTFYRVKEATGIKIFSRKARQESGATSLGVLPEKAVKLREMALPVAVATPRFHQS